MPSNTCNLSAFELSGVATQADAVLDGFKDVCENLNSLTSDFADLSKEVHSAASIMVDVEGNEPDLRGDANYAYYEAVKLLTRPFGNRKERLLADHLRDEAKRLLALADNLDDLQNSLNA